MGTAPAAGKGVRRGGAGQAAAVVSDQRGEKSPFPGSLCVRCALEAVCSAWLPFTLGSRVAFLFCFGVGLFVCGWFFCLFFIIWVRSSQKLFPSRRIAVPGGEGCFWAPFSPPSCGALFSWSPPHGGAGTVTASLLITAGGGRESTRTLHRKALPNELGLTGRLEREEQCLSSLGPVNPASLWQV